MSEFDLDTTETFITLGGIRSVVALTSTIIKEHGLEDQLFPPEEIIALEEYEQLRIRGIVYEYNEDLSILSNLRQLLRSSAQLEEWFKVTHHMKAMLQHLVGAKLDLVLGKGKVEHHGANVADGPTLRPGDFLLDKVSIHVTMAPSEALIRKCQTNLDNGLKPVIITLSERLELADGLLVNAGLERRVDVLDVLQFLTANIYEHSLFKVSASRGVLANLLIRYNELVQLYETDPALRVDMGKA